MNEFYEFVSNSPWISFFLVCVVSSFVVNIYKVSCQFILSLILRQNCIVDVVEEQGSVYTQTIDLSENNKD